MNVIKQTINIGWNFLVIAIFSFVLNACSDGTASVSGSGSASDRDTHGGSSSNFSITEASWDSNQSRLSVSGKGERRQSVTVSNAATNETLGTVNVSKKLSWRYSDSNLSKVPCRVLARQSNGKTAEMDVANAPADCDNGGGNGGGGTGGGTGGISGDFTVLAANDLGIHCADQDYRMFSILPPYNVLNAQVLQKGAVPRLMSPADGIRVTYKAVESNYFSDLTDRNSLPALTDSITSTGDNLPGVFKNNFWETSTPSATGIDKIGYKAYEDLYPPEVLSLFPSTPDLGLPAPNLVKLYPPNPADSVLTAEQAAMPGISNEPQEFHGYVETLPFFVNLPIGVRIENFNRYTAEGIPISPIDDSGYMNPYPVLRIEARDEADNVLASVDTVTPVASEADCAICHATQEVCNVDTSNTLVCNDIANSKYDGVNFIETEMQAKAMLGATPEQQVINSAKLNILRLHDSKHKDRYFEQPGQPLAGENADGTFADGSTPDVVCANCHYSPALDLAQLGPMDINGKEQTKHISMSRAMHGVHGSLPQKDPDNYGHLFPVMPPAGPGRTPGMAKQVLAETCYNCHPGKRVECLRGAMGGSGTVCQDCHGQLTQVGDDFSENFPNINFPAEGSADLSKRVPWASEPACDSCHIGDAMQVAQMDLSDKAVNATDALGNRDELRLLMAYNVSDHASNGGPDNLPLLKNPDSRFATTEALYRLSGADDGTDKGHGGLSCEGCHGSTHAIWPNANPYANDNKAANGIQGHVGTIIECNSCHEGDLGNTLEGPHGMHPVGDTRFSNGGHEDMVEHNSAMKDACRACHGMTGEGTVLARAATDRVLRNEHETITLKKGDVVTCSLCHENELR